MKIVIDIPDEIYNRATRGFLEDFDIRDVRCAIKNGTPLPKGHGDLIDVSTLLTVTDITSDGSEFTYVPYSEIEDAPTIIERDKAESEE